MSTSFTSGSNTMIIHWAIADGRLTDFRELIGGFVNDVRAKCPSTDEYRWFLSDDSTEAWLIARHADPEALLPLLAIVGPQLPRFLETCTMKRFDVFGELTDRAREAVSNLQATLHRPLVGFVR
ncbi:MAG: hypothetical protein AB7K09_12025 [Planctomycetota bacterium]